MPGITAAPNANPDFPDPPPQAAGRGNRVARARAICVPGINAWATEKGTDRELIFRPILAFHPGAATIQNPQSPIPHRLGVVAVAIRRGQFLVIRRCRAVVSPLAYAATYAQSSAHPSVGGFARQWLSLGEWPSGPAWFLWVLLAFDCAAAGLYRWMPQWGERLGGLSSDADRRPARFFGLVVAAGIVAYVPLAVLVGPMAWTGWNPWVLQSSRPFLYFVWFLAGAGVGAWGLERGLLAPDGKLARRWPFWVARALLAFGVASAVFIASLSGHGAASVWAAVNGIAFVLSCAASCFCFLALFARFARWRVRALDSLTANAYGIYLIHYAVVSWLQYALLKAALPGVAKGCLVMAGAVALSWAATAALRRIPAVARVI